MEAFKECPASFTYAKGRPFFLGERWDGAVRRSATAILGATPRLCKERLATLAVQASRGEFDNAQILVNI